MEGSLLRWYSGLVRRSDLAVLSIDRSQTRERAVKPRTLNYDEMNEVSSEVDKEKADDHEATNVRTREKCLTNTAVSNC